MKVSTEKYVAGILSIYEEKPSYELGHDGSDGKCDCIGMCRGGLERAGATGVHDMRGTNQAARKTIENLRKIDGLRLGDVVLKVRDKDDPDMPLPDKYRKGGSEYDPAVGETNFTHIGTVTKESPLEITHMTSPTAKKDTKIGNWVYQGSLPWVEDGPEPETEWAVVYAEKGSTVKMRAKPSTSCRLYWDVPIGSSVMVNSHGDEWCGIVWAGQAGYMMTRFLLFDGISEGRYTVTIPGLTLEEAEALTEQYPDGYITAG